MRDKIWTVSCPFQAKCTPLAPKENQTRDPDQVEKESGLCRFWKGFGVVYNCGLFMIMTQLRLVEEAKTIFFYIVNRNNWMNCSERGRWLRGSINLLTIRLSIFIRCSLQPKKFFGNQFLHKSQMLHHSHE